MGSSRHDKAALARLDGQLRETDPRYHAWATQAERLLPRRRRTLGPGLLLAAGATLLLLAAALHSWRIALLALITLLGGALLRRTSRPATGRPDPGLGAYLGSVAHRLARAVSLGMEGDLPPEEPIGEVAGTVVVVIGDGDPAADGALRYAADEARLRGVELVVLSTYHVPVDPDLDDIDTPISRLRANAWARAACSGQPHPASPATPPHRRRGRLTCPCPVSALRRRRGDRGPRATPSAVRRVGPRESR